MIVFTDEVFFRQEPTLYQTWGRRGFQPEILSMGRRNTQKFFGALTLNPVRFSYHQSEVFNTDTYISFLDGLVDANPEHKLLIIHDNAKYHKNDDVQDWISENNDSIDGYLLPSYSPEFNAIEYLWKWVRLNYTHNRYFVTVKELLSTVRGAFISIQKRPQQIYGYLQPFL